MNITAAERKSFKLRLDDSVSVINLVVETPDGDEIIIAYFAEGGVLITSGKRRVGVGQALR